jgi:protein-disulfide isomerase
LVFALQLARLLLLALASLSWSGCRDSSASSAESQGAPSAQASAKQADLVLPGVDTSAMTPRERREWSALMRELLAPCPNVAVSIAQCLAERRPCGSCAQAGKWVAGAVRNGASEDQVQQAYKDRFDPRAAKAIPIDGSPTKGDGDAPVTIIELADFECPHCAGTVPMLDAVIAAHPGKVRLVYKSYTLPFHTRAEPAARAAFAAGMQAKFWEMEHLLFERQQHLEDADLERYAQMLKLDVAKWKADLDAPAVRERVARDHKLGEELKVKGTPTIYVNGRELDIEQDESLEQRVASELGVSAGPAASASVGPLSPPPAVSASEKLH